MERVMPNFSECIFLFLGKSEKRSRWAKNVSSCVRPSRPVVLVRAVQTWGDRCYFVEFSLPGRKREGILSAFVDLLVSSPEASQPPLFGGQAALAR